MNQDEPMPRQEPQPRYEGNDPRMEERTVRDEEMDRTDATERRQMEDPNAEQMAMRERETQPQRMEDERDARMNGNGSGMSDTELAGYRDRFMDLQSRFIDDPQSATDQARSLVKEAVDRMMDTMTHEGDTEQMRMAMQRYRQMLETIADQVRA